MSFLRNSLRYIIDHLIYLESFFYSKNKSDKKKILLVRKDGLGDCILFYPTLAAYRKHYSESEITLMMPKWFEPLASLLDDFHFDRVVWFDHISFSRSFSYRRRFLLNLKKQGYNIALYPVFTREPIVEFMIRMADAKEIKITIPESVRSEIARDIYFAEKITGLPLTVSFPVINTTKLPEGKTTAETLIEKHSLDESPFAVIFPGAGATYRIWPADRFSKIIEHITQQGIIAVICVGPKEKKITQSILTSLKNCPNVVDLSGQTDLPTLAHILDRARFYFGSDTGILHLAVALGTPAVALVGSGGYERFFPYGDLQKNRLVYDAEYMKKNPNHIGNWDDAKELPPGKIHPSIENISVEMAKKEIDYMIHFTKQNEKNN